jgi:hypothetical protein
MMVSDIPEDAWYPPNPHPIQVFPHGAPKVARIRIGVLSKDALDAKIAKVLTMGLEAAGNDTQYYYFVKKVQLLDANARPVVLN